MANGLLSWSLPIPLTLLLVLTACIYTRGWAHLWRTVPGALPAWRLSVFLAGLFSLWVAVASLLSVLDHQWLIVHMVQHLLLMTVAAPLILLGEPLFALTVGRHMGRRPLRSWPGRILTQPAFCWLAGTTVVMGWHIRGLFELGMGSPWWHEVEHASFFAAGLLFWLPVILPWPGVAMWPRWSPPLYLFLATLPCDALSAFLTFCDRVVYPSYRSPHLHPGHLQSGMSALQDQQWAGTLMWVWVTFAYMVPAVAITIRILSPDRLGNRAEVYPHASRHEEPAAAYGVCYPPAFMETPAGHGRTSHISDAY